MDTFAELRQVELKTHDNDRDHQSSKSTEPDEACCARVLSQISSLFACSKIIACISQTLTHSYDLLTILISIADVTTDVWVIYKFYIDKRETFFIISLIVMILAQLSYAIAFVFRFQPQWTPKLQKQNIEMRALVMFFIVLPLAPVLSFIIYWCEMNDKNWFLTWLSDKFYIGDELDLTTNDPNQPKILIWIKTKARKHMGFILEAMVEALPQSIIQLIAIVYYQDTEIINVISICISLLSVATKTMVFSVAIDFKVFIYNWLSLVCDFFGVFAIICWVFYNPNEPGEITSVGQVWLYKTIIMWISSCILIGIPMACVTFHWAFWISRDQIARDGCCHVFLNHLPAILLWLVFYSFGCVFAIVLCEIIGFAPFAAFMFNVEHERHMGSNSQYGKMLFDFIFDNKSLRRKTIVSKSLDPDNANKNVKTQTVIIKTDCKELQLLSKKIGNKVLLSKQEQLFRLIFINYCCIKYFVFAHDVGLIEYLDKNIDDKHKWLNITLTSLGENSNRSGGDSDEYKFTGLSSVFKAPFVIFPQQIKKKLENARNDNGPYLGCDICCHKFGVVYVYFMLFIFFPLFLLSRLFSIFFPLIAIIYFNFDIESIQLLQWILTILYVIFMCAWIIAAIRCYNFYRVTMQLFPGLSYWYERRNGYGDNCQDKRCNLMQDYYNRRLNDRFAYDQAKKIVIEILGKDIGGLVVSFWPKFELKQWLTDLKDDLTKYNVIEK